MQSLVVVGVIAATAAAASAAPGPGAGAIVVIGEVTAATSRWTSDGSRIVTVVEVRAADGTVTTVSQLGGTVGTLTMRTLPGPALLAPGMAVEIIARPAKTAAGADVLAAEAVVVVRDSRQPFVRTGPTPGGNYLYWASSCAHLAVGAEGTRAIANDDELDVVTDVLATWNTDVATCSYLNLVYTGRLEDQEVGSDYLNILKFRDVTWCRPAIDDDPARCYSQNTAGITTVTYVDDPGSSRDGEIVDADIELNGVDFAIAVDGVSLGDSSCQADLANTLTHEVGHLLGLEHTCRVPDDPPREDGDGNPVPLCSAASGVPAILDATMYNFQECGETKKASLAADDIAAICATYPAADDPGSCTAPDDGTGCCDAGTGSRPFAPVGLAVLVLLGVLGVTRRSRMG